MARGVEKETKGLEELPGNLRGYTAQQDGVIYEESIVDWLNPRFERKAWNLTVLKEPV